MKAFSWLIVTLFIISFLVGCSNPIVTSQSPTYSQNQVISIVQAQYPVCFKHELVGVDANGIYRYTILQTPTLLTAAFKGFSPYRDNSGKTVSSGVWEVLVNCPPGYFLFTYNSGKYSQVVYFYEYDGSLRYPAST